jgi:cytochrome P450
MVGSRRVIQRNTRQQPTSFRPSRWADGLARCIPRFAYFPFGGGPRIWIGNAFAMTEAALVPAFLVQRYRFQHVPGRAVVPMASLTLRPRGGLWMRLQPR